MVKQAVILAAGMCTRLKEKTRYKPKGFLEIEGISLIERSVTTLLQCGIERIYIGTGYLSEVYDKFAEQYSQIECIFSSKYETTGSMYTLYNMQDKISGNFLLLESDILYEKKALELLIYEEREDIILSSGRSYSGDEVYIETDDDGNLVELSKDIRSLNTVHSELVGISKLSYKRYELMCSAYKDAKNSKIDYEHTAVLTSRKKPFYVKKEPSLLWCEIDDSDHLRRAVNRIFPQIKTSGINIKRKILLNPGPSTTTDSVKMAQVVPDICPREKEFGNLLAEISFELTRIVTTTEHYTTVLFGGSGTAGVESVLSSVIPSDGKVLILNNGSYGARMCEIVRAYGIKYCEFKSSPIMPVDLNMLESQISSEQGLSHIAVVHNETSTGLLNDLTSIGKLASHFNLELIVDAMSSYAAIPITMEHQNISYLCASSNKNLQGMAGIAFVIANIEALEKTESIKPRNLYLNLFAQYKYFVEYSQMRFTPPVQTLYALKQAIHELKKEGGTTCRYQRYSDCYEILLKGLKELGFSFIGSEKYRSKIITSIKIPQGVNFNKMHDFLYQNDITIYPGKIKELNVFRIANIGDLRKKDIDILLTQLKSFLQS